MVNEVVPGVRTVAVAHASALLRHIRRLNRPAGVLTDRQLLEQFTTCGDETAFAELVGRHGAMVLGVCRRSLRGEQDAEDAFQAAFLVLARKAASIRKGESLTSWLYGVAWRSAARLRSDLAERRRREQAAVPSSVSEPPDPSWREVQEALHEELARLPEKYRAPLIACYLEGRTQCDAAKQLGWGEGVLRGRLDRGRERLRQRLVRRGITLSAALLAAVVVPNATASMTLIRSTAKLVAGTPRVPVAAIANAVCRGLLAARFKCAAWLLVAVTAVSAVGYVLSTAHEPAQEPPKLVAAKADANGRRPKVDVYGDSLPDDALLRLGTVRQRHAWSTSCAAFTSDSKTVIVCDHGGRVIFWDVATGKEIRRIQPDLGTVNSLAVSADGKLLATGSWGKVQLSDPNTGAAVTAWTVGNDAVMQIAFAPDGKTLALRFQGKSIELWDVASGKKLHTLEGHLGNVFCMAFAPDGKSLASGSWKDSNVRIWDVTAGKQVRAFAAADDVLGIAYAPDGKTLATAGNGSRVRFWDPATGKRLREADSPHAHGLTELHYLPSGKTLIGLGGMKLRSFDADSGKLLHESEGAYRNMGHLAISPDGKLMATSWGGPHTFDLWEAATLKLHHAFQGHRHRITALAFAGDGKTLFSGAEVTGDRLTEWALTSGKVVRQLGGEISGAKDLALSPDRRFLAACEGDSSICLYDLTTGKEARRFKGHASIVVSVCFSADGKTMVSGSWYDKSLRLWDVATGKERLKFALEQDWPCPAVLSPDGKMVVSGGFRDGTVRAWDTTTGKVVREIPTPHQPVYTVAFTPDGKILAVAGTSRTLTFHDAATGKLVREIGGLTSSWTASVAFSPDGRNLAAAGNDNEVSLWEVASFGRRASFKGHAGPAYALAFSPDGKRLASGGDDTTILVWDVAGPTPAKPPSDKEVDALWTDLGGEDAAKAHRAVWVLAAAPRQALPLFQRHLKPAAAPSAQAREQFAKLLVDLDSDEFATRQKADLQLEKLGPEVEPLARQALEGDHSVEVRRHLQKLIDRIDREEEVSWLRTTRVLEVLEHAGTPEANQLLRNLADGAPHSRLASAAKATSERLAKPAAR